MLTGGRRSRRTLLSLAIITLGCRGAEPAAPAPASRPAPPSPVVPAAVARIHIEVGSAVPIVGETIDATLYANSADGASLPTSGASYSVTGPATFVSASDGVRYDSGGRPIYSANVRMFVRDSGRVVISARLGAVSDSAVINVPAIVPITSAMVIDSVGLVEYWQPCATGCRTLVYAPYLRLRVPAGQRGVTVLRFDFTSPILSTGSCAGQLGISAGSAADIFAIDPYLYSNEFIYAAPSNLPVPDMTVSVSVLIRDATGGVGWMTKQGGIQRNASFDDLPHAGSGIWYWSCP